MKYNLTALMKYLKDEFGAIHERFDEMRQDFSSLQSSADKIATTSVEHSQELKIINHRTARMENWIIKASRKINLPYDK